MAIPEKNYEAILAFSESCFAEGLSTQRVVKYLGHLQKIAKLMPRLFEQATKKDVEIVIGKIERSDYAEWTKHDYRVAMKKFFRWLRQTEDGYPPEVKWLRTTMRRQRTKLPEEILTPDEVQAMIVSAQSVRDKAFISSLYESGCRISELRCLRMKQICQHPHGFQITVEGMKGSRRLLLIASSRC